jgi:hypothetical protein
MSDQASAQPSQSGPGRDSAKKDQRLQFRVALIGAISALFGALIGGAATLVGSIYQQHSAAASQIQSERQNYYTSYNVASTSFYSAAEFVMLDAKTGMEWKKAMTSLQTAETQFVRTGSQANLIASSSLSTLIHAEQINADYIDLHLQQLTFRITYPKAPITPGTPSETTLLASLSSEFRMFRQQEDRFTSLARTDLGTN